MTALTTETIRSLPKVALHEHLDGCLRPATVLELEATERGSSGGGSRTTPEQTADWFFEAASSGSLPSYLQTFDRTIAVMQTAENLSRVAREFVLDMAADGAVYAETRWAPEQHLLGGLDIGGAIDAVQTGLDEGMRETAETGRPVIVRQIISLLRQHEPEETSVREAVRRGGRGVVGVDLAGPELGFPASRFRDQIDLARAGGLHVTIHAGEADGPESIRDAVECGAERIGHGVRLVEDLLGDVPGAVARRVLDEQITLEVCPTSNVQTAAFPDIASHPAARLARQGFRVAISCDNRLMGRTDLSRELSLLTEHHGWGEAEILLAARRGMEAAFCDEATRGHLLEVIDAGSSRGNRNA